MAEILAILCLLTALGLLILLSIIDIKTFLLPNIYVFPFAALAPIFHILTDLTHLNIQNIILGGIIGYTVLYLIRLGGNKYFKQDSLGLGDVKLLGAGGLWLGPEGILFAMTAGAFFGLLHGLAYGLHLKVKNSEPVSFSRLAIPAGPGFAAGIILVAGWMYKGFVLSVVYDYMP